MTPAERMIIFNQFEILKSLNPAQADEYERKQSVITAGYTTCYDDVFGSITEGEADEAMQREVWDTLDMFRALSTAKRNGWTPTDPSRSHFEGFDGNNDDHYFFAGHLLDTVGLYSESSPNKNSHSSITAHQYRRMVTEWNKCADKYSPTSAEAENIIAA